MTDSAEIKNWSYLFFWREFLTSILNTLNASFKQSRTHDTDLKANFITLQATGRKINELVCYPGRSYNTISC